jgi:hypothetical protein
MADISLPWGGEITVDETGDIASVSGIAELQQRVIRRFLTNSYQPATGTLPPSPPDYIYDGNYGGNARLYVDRRLNSGILATIQKRLLDSATSETEVSLTAPPIITAYYAAGAVYVSATIYLANGDVLPIPQMELS